MRRRKLGPLPCFANPPVEQRCIALGKVRHVGEPVVLVVADTRYIAEDAIGLIKVEYEPLPAVSDMMDAINSRGDAVLHPERGPNNVAEHRNYVFGPVDQEFAQAAHVIKRHLRWARSGGQPIETAGAVASFDEGSDKFTIHVNGSMYNYIGFTIATALKVASHQVNHRAGRRWRQLRQQTVPAQSGRASALGARAPASGQIHRGSHRQHHRMRQSRIGPHLRRRACARRQPPNDRAALQGRGRLRRVFPVSGSAPTATASRRRSARTRSARSAPRSTRSSPTSANRAPAAVLAPKSPIS